MTAPEIIAFAVVLFVGLPAMLRNWTAAGLVASFVAANALYIVTRAPLPTEILIVCDFIVVTAIFLKGAWLDQLSGSGIFGKAWAAFAELSRSDKIVLGIFLPCWLALALDMSPVQRFWILWTLGLLQFFVAGAEAFASWRRGRAASSEAHPADWFLRQRYSGHGC